LDDLIDLFLALRPNSRCNHLYLFPRSKRPQEDRNVSMAED
jgi:hypothetical protein